MKDIFATIGKILGLIFAVVVIGFTTSLTLSLAERLIPENTLLQWMTVILFDGAALVWFIQFITEAKGTIQWALSGLGFAAGLLGAVIMAGGELVLGQQLVVVEDPEKIGWALVATVVIAALVHATLIYLFHFSNPQVRNRIENAQKVSQAIERAYADARGRIDDEVDRLVAGLVESVVDEARKQIDSVTALHIREARHAENRAREIQGLPPVVDAGPVIPAPVRASKNGRLRVPLKLRRRESPNDRGNPTLR